MVDLCILLCNYCGMCRFAPRSLRSARKRVLETPGWKVAWPPPAPGNLPHLRVYKVGTARGSMYCMKNTPMHFASPCLAFTSPSLAPCYPHGAAKCGYFHHFKEHQYRIFPLNPAYSRLKFMRWLPEKRMAEFEQ